MRLTRVLLSLRFKSPHYSSYVRQYVTKHPVMYKTPVDEDPSYRTYQEMVYFYLYEKIYWKTAVSNLVDYKNQNEFEFENIDNYLVNKSLNSSLQNEASKEIVISNLPSYIATMKNRSCVMSNQTETINLCDTYCSEIFDTHLSPSFVSSFEFIHGWLNYFHPQFTQMQHLTCFGKLLQSRCREVLSNSQGQKDDDDRGDGFRDKLVHLIFLAGIGKKSFDSHEILNQIATFCDTNNAATYQVWTPFDMAIVCESFFKGGMRIESEKSLLSIANTLCNFLTLTLQEDPALEHFNPFVIISLLKPLRQVNFIDAKLLSLLSELILHPLFEEKVSDIRFIINVAAAFSFPGCQNMHPKASTTRPDLSMDKVLKRMDNLVVNILQQEMPHNNVKKSDSGFGGSSSSRSVKKDAESTTTCTKTTIAVGKSRLKDVAKWWWISSSLGYQMRSEIYLKDLSRRWNMGQFTKKSSDVPHAVDALLALAIMNQYPDSLVVKILHSADFRSAVKVNCSNRHKGRFGLFLTCLRIEGSSTVWNQLSPRDEHQWFEAVRTPFTMNESNSWSCSHRRVKPLKVPGIKDDFKPHTQLLNMVMDALNQIFSDSSTFTNADKLKNGHDRGDGNSFNTTSSGRINSSSSAKLTALLLKSEIDVPYQTRQAQVFVGYAVPYLFIPGIKIVFPSKRNKEIYVEVLDDIGLSPSYHSFKMRLMDKMHLKYFKVSRNEIQDLDASEIQKLLQERYSLQRN
ncbi:uncharacterized protein LOC110859743 [Folsomia candida]|uniref:uncharacterized protein LOC110859743 n=1 Tax=Folsomia candida TaxID=158441 RepID=UPI000B8FF679|nr:uncharacterized protein LOC110859743 [Folsomia candida]